MTVCKFFLQGSCKFGDQCRFEHPRNNARGQPSNRNAFAALSNPPADGFGPRQGQQNAGRGGGRNANQGGGGGSGDLANRISGFGDSTGFGAGSGNRGRGANNFSHDRQGHGNQRGRGGFQGRGDFQGGRGFQGRGGGRRDNRQHHTDTYGITPHTFQQDLQESERPSWVCSCYGPGQNPPINLIGGSDLEISPEELRIDHYLKAMNNQEQESATLEQMLLDEMNKRVNAILSDPYGAIDYIVEGQNEHPNRLDTIKEYKPDPREVRWGQFSRENQRKHRGVFADQLRDNENAFNRGGFQQDRPTNRQVDGFNINGSFGAQSRPPAEPDNLFARPPANPSFFPNSNNPTYGTPRVEEVSMSSPVQTPFLNNFAQSHPNNFGHANMNTFPQSNSNTIPQSNSNAFGQPHPNALTQPPSNTFGQKHPSQPSEQPPQSNNHGQMPNGTPQAEPQQPLSGERAELKAAYDYMVQHRRFKDGFIPETPPEQDWIS